MENIQLTKDELEMIRLKREQDELAAKQKEVEKQIKRQKRIDDERNRIEKFIKEKQTEKAVVEGFLNTLNSFHILPVYELITRTHSKQFKLYDWVDGENDDVYFLEDVPFDYYKIKRIGYHFEIEANYNSRKKGWQTVYDWFLRYDYKNYKSAKTVDTKINDKIETLESKKLHEQKQLSSKEIVSQILTDKYPEATIKHDSEWISNRWDKDRGGYSQGYFTVKFENGVELKCIYRTDGTYSSEVKYLYNVISNEELIELVKNLPKKEK